MPLIGEGIQVPSIHKYMHLSGKVAVITGAGSGIGKALALRLADAGNQVALVDINAQYLEEVQALITSRGGKSSVHVTDIGCRDSVQRLVEDVVQTHDGVDILINNAGVSLARMSLQEISWDQWEWMMNVNFWGTLHCTKLFFPHLRRRSRAQIVNVSSVFSLGGIANRSAYCASKFAVRGMTEALNQEVKGTNVRVTSVMPGGVSTKIAQHCEGWADPTLQAAVAKRHQEQAFTSPDRAARVILRGMRRNKRRVLIGPDAYFMNFIISYFRPCMDWIAEMVVHAPERRRLKATQRVRKD